MSIVNDFKSILSTSLEANTLSRCSRWACKYRIMSEPFSGPWTFIHHPWLKEIMDDNSIEVVIQKGAQLGFTEYSISRTLFTLDQLKRNVLYALPNQVPDAGNFSKGRLNTATENSEYLNTLFSKGKSETHKISKYGNNLYIRGARSRAGFKQVDVSLVVLDEVDEMTDEAIGLARQRLSGQPENKRQLILLSTPSIDGIGINKEYVDTTQNEFHFKCPHCSRYVYLFYPDCLVVTADDLTDPNINKSHYICYKCKKELKQAEKPAYLSTGVWVPKYPGRPLKGYHTNQMYSAGATAADLARQEIRGRFNVFELTEFYNSCLGRTFVAEGSRVTDKDIENCKKSYNNDDYSQAKDKLITIGCDVGQNQHHVSVVGWNFSNLNTRDITVAAYGRLLYFGKVLDMDELEALMQKWKPKRVVIDAQPDTKNTVALCKKYMGVAYVCYYSISKNSRQIVLGNVNECSLSVNRTFWIDASLGKIKTQTLDLPQDLLPEYSQHLMALTKVYKKSDDGNMYSEYVTSNSDHYAHSLNYAMIALGLTAGSGENEVS